MGRIKQGLDYFPMNTDFIHDRMVRRIMKREGDAAFVILVEAYSYIYSGRGYYVFADNEFYDELTDNLYNTELSNVKHIIALAVEYGLFDARLFKEYGILTSANIQRQYLFITKRRSSLTIEAAYCLLEPEEIASYRGTKNSSKEDEAKTANEVTANTDEVTFNSNDVTLEPENATFGTQNKEKKNKEKQIKTNNLPNPPSGGDGRGNMLKPKRDLTQEDIDCMQAPPDGAERNFEGLRDNLRLYKVPPPEQYAIILKSNFGAIGGAVWKGFGVIRGSNGKIKLPGHYLLSVLS